MGKKKGLRSRKGEFLRGLMIPGEDLHGFWINRVQAVKRGRNCNQDEIGHRVLRLGIVF